LSKKYSATKLGYMVNFYDAPAKELLVAGPVATIIRWERTVIDAIYILEELTQVTSMFLLHSILLITESILCSFLVRQSLKRLFIIHKCFLMIKTNEMHYSSNLFWYGTTCFGQVYCPSSGV
jgi:hypothetical protein